MIALYLWVNLWNELFRSGNNQITVLQLVVFALQEGAEEFFQMFKFRLNAAGIVAVVCTHKSIAESFYWSLFFISASYIQKSALRSDASL